MEPSILPSRSRRHRHPRTFAAHAVQTNKPRGLRAPHCRHTRRRRTADTRPSAPCCSTNASTSTCDSRRQLRHSNAKLPRSTTIRSVHRSTGSLFHSMIDIRHSSHVPGLFASPKTSQSLLLTASFFVSISTCAGERDSARCATANDYGCLARVYMECPPSRRTHI